MRNYETVWKFSVWPINEKYKFYRVVTFAGRAGSAGS